MSTLLTLIKTNLRESLDTRKLKENKSKTTSFLVFVTLMGLLFTFISVIYNVIFVFLCNEMQIHCIESTVMMGGIATMLVLSTAVVRAKSVFEAKDYEMLRSMPIKKSYIITAKIINMYVIELIYTAVIMIPNGVILAIMGNGIIHIPSSLVITLLLPGLPIVVGSLLGLCASLFFDSSKLGYVLSTLFYFAFFVCIFVLSFTVGNSSDDLENMSEMFAVFGYLSPTLRFVKLAFTQNPLWYLAFVGVNVALLLITVALIACLFDRVYENRNLAKSKKQYKVEKITNKGEFKTLFAHEAKRYFSMRNYLLNTAMSGILTVAALAFISYSIMSDLTAVEPEAIEFIRIYAYISVLLMTVIMGIATPASVSLSVEGKQFYLIKSLPISYVTLAKVKILFSTLVMSVFTVIASVVTVVFIQPDIINSLFIIIAPVVYNLGVSSLSLFINMHFMKLKWNNEVEVVKNSGSVIVCMLVDLLVSFVVAAVMISSSFVNPYVSMAVTLVVFALFALIFYKASCAKISKKIEKQEDF